MSLASKSLGEALGNAIAGYRDKDPARAAAGLADVVEIVRGLEERIASLEAYRSNMIVLREAGL